MKLTIFFILIFSLNCLAQSGDFTPTVTPAGNDTVLAVHKMRWIRTGKIVFFSGSFVVAWKNQNYGMVWDDFKVTLPQASDFTLSGLNGTQGDVTAVVTRSQSHAQTINWTPSGTAFAFCDPVTNTICIRADPMHTMKPPFPQGRTQITFTGSYLIKP